jgi:hypothetical protein
VRWWPFRRLEKDKRDTVPGRPRGGMLFEG